MGACLSRPGYGSGLPSNGTTKTEKKFDRNYRSAIFHGVDLDISGKHTEKPATKWRAFKRVNVFVNDYRCPDCDAGPCRKRLYPGTVDLTTIIHVEHHRDCALLVKLKKWRLR